MTFSIAALCPRTGEYGCALATSSMAAGGSHTCVAMKSGGVRCWGANGSGQLGDGATLDHLFATDVTGLGAAAISVVAGATHTCALLADHTVKCWGSNLHGEIGNASVAAAVCRRRSEEDA